LYVSYNIFLSQIDTLSPDHAACKRFLDKVQGKKIQNAVTSDFSIYAACSVVSYKAGARHAKEFADSLYAIFQCCDGSAQGNWRQIVSAYGDIPLVYAVEAGIIDHNKIKSVVSTDQCFTKLGIIVIHPKDA
jgi:hypothetical protein